MSVKNKLVDLISHSFATWEKQSDYTKRGMEKFKEQKLPEQTLDDFINQTVDMIVNQTNRNSFTIVSKQDFDDLIKKDYKNQLVYTPLNDHSRDKLSLGSLLFSYRSGQFGSLDKALDKRGIYGIGFVLTEPFLLEDGIDNPKHTDYGVWVGYPIKLDKILSVRNIQLNPITINLTPYNGNRNDALQYIKSSEHTKTLLGMILALNPELIDEFNEMNLNFGEMIVPEKLWKNRDEDINPNNFDYRNEFKLWMKEHIDLGEKTQSNYISALNSLERVWNESQDYIIDIWGAPFELFDKHNINSIINNHDEIYQLNKNQNNYQSAALAVYEQFLNYISNNRDIVGINKLFFGAPGSGKSYSISSFIRNNGMPSFDNQKDYNEVIRITLHPEYSYSDFIGQIMPVTKRNNEEVIIKYEFRPGPFTNALEVGELYN